MLDFWDLIALKSQFKPQDNQSVTFSDEYKAMLSEKWKKERVYCDYLRMNFLNCCLDTF